MKFFYHHFLLLSFYNIIISYKVINNDSPICKKCIHFIPVKFLGCSKEEKIYYGKCKLYGNKNILSGKINYEFASIAREYYSCGYEGKNYIYDPYYKIKLFSNRLYKIIIKVNKIKTNNNIQYNSVIEHNKYTKYFVNITSNENITRSVS